MKILIWKVGQPFLTNIKPYPKCLNKKTLNFACYLSNYFCRYLQVFTFCNEKVSVIPTSFLSGFYSSLFICSTIFVFKMEKVIINIKFVRLINFYFISSYSWKNFILLLHFTNEQRNAIRFILRIGIYRVDRESSPIAFSFTLVFKLYFIFRRFLYNCV